MGSQSPSGLEAVALAPGAALLLPRPAGAAREPDEAVPSIDLSNLPGGRLVARRAFRDGALTIRALCVAAPASGWAEGVEEIVLGRANQLAKDALGGEVTSFTVGDAKPLGQGFDQRFEAQVRHGEEAFSVRGRHWLGFAGEPRDAFACTVVCSEPPTAHACADLVAGVTPSGAWLGPPPPNLLARTLMLAATNPWPALGVLVLVSLLLAAAVVAGRPRPRP